MHHYLNSALYKQSLTPGLEEKFWFWETLDCGVVSQGKKENHNHKPFKTNCKTWTVQCKEQNDTKRNTLNMWMLFPLLWLHRRTRPSRAWITVLLLQKFPWKNPAMSLCFKTRTCSHTHTHTHIQIWIFYSDTWNSLTWAPFVGRNGKCAQHIQLARREFELMLCELYLWGKKANHNLPFPHINPEKHPLVFFFGNISLMALFKGPNHLCEEILRAVYIFKINMLLQYSSLKSTEIYILLCYRK